MERDFDGNFRTDRGKAVESNARCWEELALVRTFSTFPGINNVNPISPGFDLMNQNEALAHKSVARCHFRAGQLKLWGPLLLIHYPLLSVGLFLVSGWVERGLVLRLGPNVHRGAAFTVKWKLMGGWNTACIPGYWTTGFQYGRKSMHGSCLMLSHLLCLAPSAGAWPLLLTTSAVNNSMHSYAKH